MNKILFLILVFLGTLSLLSSQTFFSTPYHREKLHIVPNSTVDTAIVVTTDSLDTTEMNLERDSIPSVVVSEEHVEYREQDIVAESDTSQSHSRVDDPPYFWVPIAVIAALIAFIWLITSLGQGLSTRCVKCRKLWASEVKHSRELDRWIGVENITKTDIVKDKDGRQIGTIDREESVSVTYCTSLVTYKCKFCGAIWQKNITYKL